MNKRNKIKFEIVEKEKYTIVKFKLDENLLPEDLLNLTPPEVVNTKGVVISGRGPIWLYGYLIHHYHPVKFIATHDPRIGAIVIESHSNEHKVGEVLKVEKE